MDSHSFMHLFLALLLPLLLIILLVKNIWQKDLPAKLPPGPAKLPLIGNLHQLGDKPHHSLRRLSSHHGPLMFLQLGSVPTVVVSSAVAAREIFKSHDRVYSDRPSVYVTDRFTYGSSSVTFSPYNDYWREIRKIVVLELLSPKRIQEFESIRDEETARITALITQSTGAVVNLSELMLLLSNKVIRRVAFGENSGKRDNQRKSDFHEIFRETQDLAGSFNVADYFPWLWWINKFNGFESRIEKNFGELDRFFEKLINDHQDPRRNKSDHEDVIDVLLRIQKDPTQAIRLTNEQIKAILVDIFIAGTDTSSATLVWTMTELIRNPSVMKKAQEEVRKIANGKAQISESDLQNMTYLKLVLKESLRLHPPAPLLIPRETTEPTTVLGYEIPSKTRVLINASAIAMDPNVWENPEVFDPERFANSPVDFRGQHFELLPFGAGRRSCPGISFSIVLIELILANLLCKFDWRLPERIRVEDIDMEEALGITVNKKTPLCLVAFVPS